MVPPHDMPDAKKRMVEPAGRWLQRAASVASKVTSFGTRTTRPVNPERMKRPGASTSVTICTPRRTAALRSALSSEAMSTANDSMRAREVPRGSAGSRIAARMAMIATTQTISSKVKPASPGRASARPTGDVRRGSSATFLSVRAIGEKIIGAVLSRRAVDIGSAPGIGRNNGAFQVRSVPGRDGAGTLHQRREALGGVRVSPGVEEEQIERAAEALDLDFRRFGFRFGQVVEHTRTDQPHDQPDDGDHHENFDQREAALAVTRPAATFPVQVAMTIDH